MSAMKSFLINHLVVLPLFLRFLKTGAAEIKVSHIMDLENFLPIAEPCQMAQR